MTLYQYIERLIGVKERPGPERDHPFIEWCLELDTWETAWHDEVPWCSALINRGAWHLRLTRSKSLRARSWLGIGQIIMDGDQEVGNDIVILRRGGPLTGPDGPGHVGMWAGRDEFTVRVLAGNQSDEINFMHFPIGDVLGYRRLCQA